MNLTFKRDQILPVLIGAGAALLTIITVINLPSMRFVGIDWRLAILAGLGFLTFKIYRWSQNLFAEIPP